MHHQLATLLVTSVHKKKKTQKKQKGKNAGEILLWTPL
jgi:hypothetical protein